MRHGYKDKWLNNVLYYWVTNYFYLFPIMTCLFNICNLTENILWVINVKQMWTWISKAWKIMEQNSENLSSKFSVLEKAVQCCQFWGSWFRSRFSLNTTNPTIKSRASVSEIKKKSCCLESDDFVYMLGALQWKWGLTWHHTLSWTTTALSRIYIHFIAAEKQHHR